ncbi:MAG: class I SAM-dependent methyltransferase [Oscillospiraceae bacterium]|jgi:23S rRNA (cytosine1962-C5)-methyltransferase|nr:class I SAM-dependent methyltransferase [Oscillospiraceae bacterium]
MWISDKWSDYELIDCSRGERLERWGEYLLVRPDPAVIWATPREHPGWRGYSARYERSPSGGGRWSKRGLPESWRVRYGDLTFNVKPTNFKHTGLFPEQAVNWDYLTNTIAASGRRLNVLNLFAYTGGATAAAAAAGAAVCHVDAARGMVSWARENARASGLQDRPVRWLVDDCAGFLEREIRRGHKYDALLMDPPSYGRGPSGEVWKLEDDLYRFAVRCAGVLCDSPAFIIINSYTTGLSPAVLTYIADTVFTKRFGGRAESRELGLPVTSHGLILPCGSTCRWNPVGAQA